MRSTNGHHDTIVLVGSQALKHYVSPGRPPADWDLITTFDGLQLVTSRLRQYGRVDSIPLSENKTVLRCYDGPYRGMVEVEIAWPETAAEKLLSLVPNRYVMFADLQVNLPSLDQLYTIKMSHRYLKNSPHFRKTRDDIMTLRKLGCNIFDEQWLKHREDETYVYKHPKLNVMKKDFFKGDGVEYVYDHDDIHRVVAHYMTNPAPGIAGPLPAYELYKEPGQEVKCSKSLFFSLSEDVRLNGVLEEAQVLALERSQIPFRGKVSPRRSFDIALMKVCTSITSGWFREYAWENFHKVEEMYEVDYVDRFWAAVAAGKVRKLQSDEKTY